MSSEEPRARTRLRPGPPHAIAWALLFALAACHLHDLPKVPRPPVVERSDEPAPLPSSHLRIPLVADLRVYEPVLANVLREHVVIYQDSWTRATGPGVSPVVETKMEGRLGTPTLRIDGKSVRVEVPITYWGEVRARPRSGAMWLSPGTPWGSESNPGRATLTLTVRPDVDERWRLKTKTKLVSVSLDAPDIGEVCTDTILRVCVAPEIVTKFVHGLIEREVRKKAPSLLAALDRAVQQQADFRTAVEMGFKALSTPPGPGTLWLDVERMGLGPLGGDAAVAHLDLDLTFRPSWSERRADKKPELPARTGLSKEADSALRFDILCSFDDLSAALTEQLRSVRADAFQVARAEALGAVGPSSVIAVALDLVQEERSHTVYVAAVPTATAQGFRLAQPRLSTASRALLEEIDVDEGELLEGFEKSAQVELDARVRARLTDLQNRLALLTLAFGAVTLELETVRYGDVWFEGRGLGMRVETTVKPQGVTGR